MEKYLCKDYTVFYTDFKFNV